MARGLSPTQFSPLHPFESQPELRGSRCYSASGATLEWKDKRVVPQSCRGCSTESRTQAGQPWSSLHDHRMRLYCMASGILKDIFPFKDRRYTESQWNSPRSQRVLERIRGFCKFEGELGEKRAACVIPVLTQATKPPDPE